MELDTWRAFITTLPAFAIIIIIIIIVEMHSLQQLSIGNLEQISCVAIIIDCTTIVAC